MGPSALAAGSINLVSAAMSAMRAPKNMSLRRRPRPRRQPQRLTMSRKARAISAGEGGETGIGGYNLGRRSY